MRAFVNFTALKIFVQSHFCKDGNVYKVAGRDMDFLFRAYTGLVRSLEIFSVIYGQNADCFYRGCVVY